jgi:exodeoxyribonuclease-3
MKIISYNVNGIRSALSKGLIDWLNAANPDIFCVQELKADENSIDKKLFESLGYHCYLFPAQKKGYSGVGIFSKIKPNHVAFGCNNEEYDQEGRVLRLDFDTFSIMNVYMPSGSSGEERQDFKFKWLDYFLPYAIQKASELKNLIIAGDYNICHKPIDIHNPISNAKSSGFLPEERAWMEKFFLSGFIDSFRYFNQEPHQYTWWSFRAGARTKNLGWRIDYQSVTTSMESRLKRALILSEAKHSDHCPTLLEID